MTNFTKLIFCLFTILIIFTSCGDGTTNSGHSDIIDNPQFEKSVLDSITVKTLPTKTQYSVDETLDPTGLVLQGNYIDYFSDGSTQTSKRDIDYNTYKNELAFSPTNLSTEGTIKITVTYNKKSTTFNITVGKSSSDSKYADWFKEVKIGGEDSPYQVYIPEHSYNDFNKLVDGSINNYLDQYQKYIASLSLNEELTGGVEIDFARIKAMAGTSEQYKLDTLIGTTSNTAPDTIKGINNVCESAIENIINNIGSVDTVVVDRAYFAIYYKAIANEAYRRGYNGELTTKNQNGTYNTNSANQMQNHYNQEKINCLNLLYNEENLPFQNKYLYDESGNLNPELVQRFDEMVVTTAVKLGIEPNKARNIMKLSFTGSVIEGMHDDLSTNNTIDHTHTDSCYNNEIYEVVIEPIAFPSLTMAQPTKLNKLNFNKDFGRELC